MIFNTKSETQKKYFLCLHVYLTAEFCFIAILGKHLSYKTRIYDWNVLDRDHIRIVNEKITIST